MGLFEYIPPIYTADEADIIVNKFMNRLYDNDAPIKDVAAELENWAASQLVMGAALEAFGANRSAFINEGASQIERLAKARWPDVTKDTRTATPDYNTEWGGDFGWSDS